MSTIAARVVTREDAAACNTYRGRLGDIVVSEDFDYIGFVTDPASAPTPIDLTPFSPSNDNGTDLGDAAHRFRSLYLGTSIINAGNLAIDLTGAARRTLTIGNSTGGGGNVCDIALDGALTVGLGASFSGEIANQALMSASGAAAGFKLTSTSLDVNGLAVTSAITGGGPTLGAYGSDANIDLIVQQKGNGGLKLSVGATGFVQIGVDAASRIAFFAGTPRARLATIANPVGGGTVDAEARAAINSILDRLRPTAGFGLIDP